MNSGQPRDVRPATIRDVAARAGVSKSLVSLVLRGDPHVSASRREAIQRAMDDLGYRPNLTARSLSRSRSDAVGVLLNDLRNPWFVDLLAGLATTLRSAGLVPLMADSHTDQRIGVRSVDSLVRQGVDALVVVGTTSDPEAVAAASQELPVVLAGTREPVLPSVDVVVNDDRAGAELATGHLVELGHTRIAHLQGPGLIGSLRAQGYQAVLREAGLSPTVFLEPGGMSEESGYAATRRVLDRPEPPTAILAFNDIAAIGALSALDDRGLRVPQDVSVVGYDNTYLARIRHLSLTSVDNGNFAVGVQAGRCLVSRLEGRSGDGELHLVPSSLVVRGSTGAAPR
ncbi:MAG: LacI family DNA-binding transcriptional regulator [Propionicimonas sp.]|uniref:LacI family DNA-binding transcriptional regulator n=1 Tax=Propionicimonas sp. TaxID=1955623 RepID=UPI002B1F8C30|nr:LacI family DNA-binding transcriptional regulator [Propionicimonas sp.]MEA4943780.1 LacI family DNA-binding transcriptional regulator [Propionicimonas sp.]MEA5052552.1 LacI family DNA-binding transcriptional regulator [Propionicimonas sp.]MEA5116481.1 LacI family DNA-binding transcriptional regulator [Propionicimonas sp.]